ncbi:unnamed protein product, partial [Agarophyton chilense]
MAHTARALSIAAVRVQTKFLRLPSVSESCASSITHVRLALYRGINGADPNGTYDGLLWRNLRVDDKSCVSLYDALHSTFFEVRASPSPAAPVDAASPWFLVGFDNSPRRCEMYSTRLSESYYFTDDLPRFRGRLERDGLLLRGVAQNAKSGTIFMFTVPFSREGTLQGPSCVFVDERDAQGITSDVAADSDANTETEAEAETDAAATPEALQDVDEDGAVCLAGDVLVQLDDGTLRRMDALQRGDRVRAPRGHDTVISLSHADATMRTKFIQLCVLVTGAETTLTTLTLTPGHLLLARNGEAFAAREARAGSALRAVDGVRAVVNSTKTVWRRGVYSPLTRQGVLVLRGGVVVSCYSELLHERVAHAMLTPVRALRLRVDWGAAVAAALRA